jgi:hypothetical protein
MKAQIIIMFREWPCRILKVCLNIKATKTIMFIGCMIILFHSSLHYKLYDQGNEHTNLNPSHIPAYFLRYSITLLTLLIA